MKQESIAQKTARTSFWGGIEKVSTLGVQFFVSLVLARLLSPSDYGIIAMLWVFIALSEQFISCGFANALIRKETCGSEDYSTAFYFNIAVSLVCYGIFFLIAPLVARFYKMDILCPVLRIFSITLPLSALRLVQTAILSRKLQAEKSAIIQLSGAVISGAIGIYMAYKGFGVWSLVAQQLSNALVCAALLWFSASWYPKWEFSGTSMRYLWGFGSKMLLTGIISSIYANIYSIVIGRCYDSSSLGIFNRGQKLARLFPEVTESVLVKNSLPIMSQVQGDRERMVHVYREFVKLACFITFPAVCLISLLAEPFVRVVLTEKWLPSVPYIQLFAMTALFFPANSVNLNLLQACGRSDYTLKAEVIKKSIGLATVFLLLRYGTWYLAIGACCMDIVALGVNLFFAKKLSGLSYFTQVKDIMPAFLSSLIMSALVFAACHYIPNPIVTMVVGVLIGAAVYFVVTRYIFKLDLYDKLRTLSR